MPATSRSPLVLDHRRARARRLLRLRRPTPADVGRGAPPPPTVARVASVAAAAAVGAQAAPSSRAPPTARADPRAHDSAAAAAAAAAAGAASRRVRSPTSIKDAKEAEGLLSRSGRRTRRSGSRSRPTQFDKPMFFSVNLARGLGENFIFGGLMGRSTSSSSARSAPRVQLVARNERYFAQPKTPEARAVAEAFSDSLLASAPIASQPHPERKSVLVDAQHAAVRRHPRRLRATSTAPTGSRTASTRATRRFGTLRTAPDAVARAGQRPLRGRACAAAADRPARRARAARCRRRCRIRAACSSASSTTSPSCPTSRCARGSPTRASATSRRRASTTRTTPSSPRTSTTSSAGASRRRIPAAALSRAEAADRVLARPQHPGRATATRSIAGVLEWNKAFERIGFKDAVQAKIQPDDADFDTLDARHASIRWMTTGAPGRSAASARRQVDPRTGEILDADIGIDPVRLRNARYRLADRVRAPRARSPRLGLLPDDALRVPHRRLRRRGARLRAGPARRARRSSIRTARGRGVRALRPQGGRDARGRATRSASRTTSAPRPSTRRRSSNDPEFTRTNGISGSVMEYTPINIALRGETQGEYSMTTLGPYDYWAIEYAYKPIAPEQEAEELAKIAARSTEPLLAFALRRGDQAGDRPRRNRRRPRQRSARVRGAPPRRSREGAAGSAGRRGR